MGATRRQFSIKCTKHRNMGGINNADAYDTLLSPAMKTTVPARERVVFSTKIANITAVPPPAAYRHYPPLEHSNT